MKSEEKTLTDKGVIKLIHLPILKALQCTIETDTSDEPLQYERLDCSKDENVHAGKRP